MMIRHVLSLAAAVALSTGVARAGTVTGLTTFTAGTQAKAAEVNGNFSAVKAAVDDNDARVTALEGRSTNVITVGEDHNKSGASITLPASGATTWAVFCMSNPTSVSGSGHRAVGFVSASCPIETGHGLKIQPVFSTDGGTTWAAYTGMWQETWTSNHNAQAQNAAVSTSWAMALTGGTSYTFGVGLRDTGAGFTSTNGCTCQNTVLVLR